MWLVDKAVVLDEIIRVCSESEKSRIGTNLSVVEKEKLSEETEELRRLSSETVLVRIYHCCKFEPHISLVNK